MKQITSIKDLKLDPKNHNKGKEKGKQLIKKSINKNGLGRSIVVSQDGTVIAGNKTVENVIDEGIENIIVVPTNGNALVVVQRTDIADNTKEFYDLSVADNATQVANFEVDYEVLTMLEEEFNIEDWQLYEQDDASDNSLEAGTDTEDDTPDLQETAITVLGDIHEFIINDCKHRIMCGDSMNNDTVSKLMNGNMADMVFTDPPYDLPNQDYVNILHNYCDNAHVFVMHDDRGIVEYLRRSKLEFKQFFICSFGFSSPRGNDPYLCHILISHEKKGNAIKHNNLHDGFSSLIKIEYRFRLKDDMTGHKHQKPVILINKFIKHYSKENDNVLDLFGGSGTTTIAAIQTQRNSYTMELSPNWCDVIVKRIIDYCQQNNINYKHNLLK